MSTIGTHVTCGWRLCSRWGPLVWPSFPGGAWKTRSESLRQGQPRISWGRRLASMTFQDAGFLSQRLSNAEKPGHLLVVWTKWREVGPIIPEPLTF